MDINDLRSRLASAPTLRPEGRVVAVTGLGIRVTLPGARIGDVIRILRRGGEPVSAAIIGFGEGTAIAIPLGELTGIGMDDMVQSTSKPFEVMAGSGLLGRILDGLGRPIDGRELPSGLRPMPIDASPPSALERAPITSQLVTGVRAIDALTPLGKGQRVGLFAGSGVGKSTLLGAIARRAEVDHLVIALVGERGREVLEFLANLLDDEARARAIFVVATADSSPLERLRAAQTATAIAESLRDEGRHVLLLIDSITRFARAQREVGLAAGEPPARRGYPPSVFAAIPRLVERAGTSGVGAITAIYTVLVEGGDLDEPVSDEVRGTVDGHILLERELAARGHFPPIDVVRSVSRVASALMRQGSAARVSRLRQDVALFEAKRDLLSLGAYTPGSDPVLERVLRQRARVERFLQQAPTEHSPLEDTLRELSELTEG